MVYKVLAGCVYYLAVLVTEYILTKSLVYPLRLTNEGKPLSYQSIVFKSNKHTLEPSQF